MDSQDKSEARAEYRNTRQSSTGKGDADNRVKKSEYDKAPIWCGHGRFKDKCEVCR